MNAGWTVIGDLVLFALVVVDRRFVDLTQIIPCLINEEYLSGRQKIVASCSRDEVLGEKWNVGMLSICHHFGGVQQAYGGRMFIFAVHLNSYDKTHSKIEVELSGLSQVFDDKKMISSDKQR